MRTPEYESSLVETAVFLAVRRDERQECEFHRVVDPLYEIPDKRRRQREFRSVFRAFFTRLGLDRVLTDLLAEHPLFEERIHRCVVCEAPRRKDESAELFVRAGENEGEPRQVTLMMRVSPPSLLDCEPLVVRMRRELWHIADMLDDRFGYDRGSLRRASVPVGLVRDRYRVLWDLYIEGRLDRLGWSVEAVRVSLRRAFDRVFPGDDAGSVEAAFERVFCASALTHRMLMDWAQRPQRLLTPGMDRGEDSHEVSSKGSSASKETRASVNLPA